MKTRIFVTVLIVLLVTACSEEKKREAARLEAQLRGDTVFAVDTIDSTAIDSNTVISATPEPVVESTSSPVQPITDSTMQASVPDTTTNRIESTDNVTSPDSTTDSTTDSSTSTSSVASLPHDTLIPDINAIPTESNPAVQPATPSMPRFIKDAYTVQVSSSNDRAFSQRIVDTFVTRGYSAYLATVTKDGTTYYRVRVGHYPTSTEANFVAVEINQKYSLQSWVDKITK